MMNYHNPLGNPITFAVQQCRQTHLSDLVLLLHHGILRCPNPPQTLQLPWFPLS